MLVGIEVDVGIAIVGIDVVVLTDVLVGIEVFGIDVFSVNIHSVVFGMDFVFAEGRDNVVGINVNFLVTDMCFVGCVVLFTGVTLFVGVYVAPVSNEIAVVCIDNIVSDCDILGMDVDIVIVIFDVSVFVVIAEEDVVLFVEIVVAVEGMFELALEIFLIGVLGTEIVVVGRNTEVVRIAVVVGIDAVVLMFDSVVDAVFLIEIDVGVGTLFLAGIEIVGIDAVVFGDDIEDNVVAFDFKETIVGTVTVDLGTNIVGLDVVVGMKVALVRILGYDLVGVLMDVILEVDGNIVKAFGVTMLFIAGDVLEV